MLSPPLLSGGTEIRNRWLDNRMSYNHAGQYSLCHTGLRDQRTDVRAMPIWEVSKDTPPSGDLRSVHIWCGDGSMLGASLAGLSCEVPSSGWWCFPSSDVLCAFYQLFCPAHVGFMDLHLFMVSVPGIARMWSKPPFLPWEPSIQDAVQWAPHFVQWSGAGLCLTFHRAGLRVRDIFLFYKPGGLLLRRLINSYPTLTSETFFNKLLKSVVILRSQVYFCIEIWTCSCVLGIWPFIIGCL